MALGDSYCLEVVEGVVKIGALKNFAMFTTKYLCRSLFLNKVPGYSFLKTASEVAMKSFRIQMLLQKYRGKSLIFIKLAFLQSWLDHFSFSVLV